MGGKELEYIQNVFDSNYIAPLGEYVNRFEESIIQHTGAAHALALNSGTAALHLALRVLGIGAGDTVLASTLTFIGSVSPILFQGATPVFIDSEKESWNLCPKLLQDAIQKEKPKALILTHLYGQSAQIKEIQAICQKNKIYLIEDAAESLGATYGDQQLGTFGDLGIYSFNGNKILTTSGGGMLVSKNKEWIDHARKLSTQAREPFLHYEHTELGYNYRLSNVLAAIGVGQMEVLNERIAKKREIFNWYAEELADAEEINWMPELESSQGIRWLTCCTLDHTSPTSIIESLEKENIESRPLWKPMHRQPLFAEAKSYSNGTSDSLFAKGLCLPSGTALKQSDIQRIAAIIHSSL